LASSDRQSSEWRAAAFRPTTDPAVLWRERQFGEVFTALCDAVARQERLVVLTGDVGTGKTILANAVAEALAADNVVVGRLLYPSLDAIGLLTGIALACSLPGNFKTRYGFLGHFAPFLSILLAQQRRAVLLIDEAQCLMDEGLEELGWVLETFKGFSVLLVGQEDIVPRLVERSTDVLARNLATRCQLEPLNEEEVREYIAHGLRVAGGKPDLLGPAVAHEVFTLSGGRPRVINLLCRAALQMAATPDIETVRRASDELTGKPADVEQETVASEITAVPATGWRRRWPASIAAALAIGIAGLIALYGVSRATRDSGAHDLATTPQTTRSSSDAQREEPEASRADTTGAPAAEPVNPVTSVTPPAEPAAQPTTVASPPALPAPATAATPPSGTAGQAAAAVPSPGAAAAASAPPSPTSTAAAPPSMAPVSVMTMTSSPRTPPAPAKKRIKTEEARPQPPAPAAPRQPSDGADPEAIIDWALQHSSPSADRP
jgi:general secretion pathway protein A